MLSATRRPPARHHWQLFCASIAIASIAVICTQTAKAQSFILYDPAISSTPQTVTSATLDELLVPGSYITAEDAEFSNFQFTAAAFGAGVVTPSAANILVTAPTSAIPELKFQGGPFLALNTQLVDASLQFDVTALDPMQKITSAELNFTGGTSGTGTTSITEDVDDMQDNLLGQRAYVVQQGFAGSSNAGTITFAGQQEVQISKDIFLNGAASGDSATLSDFTQAFNTQPVPEPSSIVMALFGGGGLIWFGWRRKTKRRDLLRTVSTELIRQTIARNGLQPAPA
jgi:hypothetical protein